MPAMNKPELWVVCGRDPVLFRIPYFVVWSQNEALMESALPLRRQEKLAVSRILALHGKPSKDQWIISRQMLEKIAEQTRGGDPDNYFAWNMPRPAEQAHVEGRTERSEFIDSLYQSGVGKSPEELAYYWQEFCRHAAHWLINKEKPVDIFFVRLHNCPYRANWKVILTQRFRRLGQAISHKSGHEREYVMDQSGFKEELLSLDLLAFRRENQTCYRHVEVEHRKPWWKNVKKIELKRKMQLGPYGYADYFLESIARFIPTAIRLYTVWLAQIAKACVADCEGGHDGRIRFVPNNLAGKLHPASREYCGLPPQVLNKLPRFKPASVPENLLAPDGRVPEMPPVQPPHEDLRDTDDARARHALAESGDGAR